LPKKSGDKSKPPNSSQKGYSLYMNIFLPYQSLLNVWQKKKREMWRDEFIWLLIDWFYN
jgi:hypothetical protein